MLELNFDGYYKPDAVQSSRQGLYIAWLGKIINNKFHIEKLLYIGMTTRPLSDRVREHLIEDHLGWRISMKDLTGDKDILYSICELSGNFTEDNLRDLEAELVYANKPCMNELLKDAYTRTTYYDILCHGLPSFMKREIHLEDLR